MNDALKIAVIGAGVRGLHLARQISANSQNCEVVAVAEPNPARRENFAREFGVKPSMRFPSWESFVQAAPPCDAAIIATMDNQHTEPALSCLRLGLHLLVEKPLSDTLDGCRRIVELQKETGLIVSVCHTLRYLDSFRKMKEIVDNGTIGKLMHIEHMEAIEHFRFSHNYVRGRWAKTSNNTFLLLHKSCHDIDIISWLAGEPCEKVSSFGALTCFSRENAPANSACRCVDCPLRATCLYSAIRLYVDNDLTGRLEDLKDASSREKRLESIACGPYGVCVWKADNDVVDHQTAGMKFASGLTANFAMTGFSRSHGRRCCLQGTEGELRFEEANGVMSVCRFEEPAPNIVRFEKAVGYHPEDNLIVANWISAIRRSSPGNVKVDPQEALRSCKIAFAAELSRKNGDVVDLQSDL